MDIFYLLIVLIVFMIILVLMFLIHASWQKFVLLAVVMTALVIFKISPFWQGWIRLAGLAAAIVLGLVILVNSRPDRQVSFRGTLIREMIRRLVRSKPDPSVFLPTEYKQKNWQPPTGYQLNRVSLTYKTLDVISTDSSRHTCVIYLLHGGAYISPLSNFYRNLACRYARMHHDTDVAVLDYRTVPQDPYPAAIEDALEGYQYLIDQGYPAQNILFIGDSAGGNLALVLTMKLREQRSPLPGGLICISLWGDMTYSGESYQFNDKKDPFLGSENIQRMGGVTHMYARTAPVSPDHPYLSPVFGTYEDFPPTLIQVGGYEAILSDSRRVCQKIIAAGGRAQLSEYPGMYHVFQYLGGSLMPEGKQAWQEIKDFMRQILP